MKTILKLLFSIVTLLPLMAFSAANDLKLSQKNSTDTAWIDRIFQPQNGAPVTNVATFGQAVGIPFNIFVAKSADFTVATTDKGKVFDVTTAASNVTATLPAAATAGNGWYVYLRKADTGVGLILTSPTTTPAAIGVGVQGHMVRLMTDGTNYYYRSEVGTVNSTGDMTFTSPGAVNLTAGGTNKAITFSPSGTGAVAFTKSAQGPVSTYANGANSNYIEFSKTGYTEKGSVGALGGFEMNLSYNMDYADGVHRFYDPTKNAIWLAMTTSGLYWQWAAAGTPPDVWTNSGARYLAQVLVTGMANFDATASMGQGLTLSKNGVTKTYLGSYAQWIGSGANLDVALASASGNNLGLYTNGASTPTVFLTTAGHALFAGLTSDGVGAIQLPAATDNTVGITLGGDINIYRTAAGRLQVDSTASDANLVINSTQASGYFYLKENSVSRTYIGYDASNVYWASTGRPLIFQPGGTTALTLDTSQNANFSTGANGGLFSIKHLNELTTIAAAATTTTTIQIPANAVVLGVSVRVTTVIPTATSFSVGDAGSATRYGTSATISTAATTTDAGTKAGAYYNASATGILLTMNGGTPADNTGRVRVTIIYYQVTPPTS